MVTAKKNAGKMDAGKGKGGNLPEDNQGPSEKVASARAVGVATNVTKRNGGIAPSRRTDGFSCRDSCESDK